MKIAVAIPTYQRPDGKTPFYLRRVLNSIFEQEYGNFKIFLVGDHYENEDELASIVNEYPSNRLYCVNLDKAMERDKYKNMKEVLWSCGGVHAHNYITEVILSEGFDYICHADHDDYWGPQHLKIINAVNKFKHNVCK